jgi:endonuclease-3
MSLSDLVRVMPKAPSPSAAETISKRPFNFPVAFRRLRAAVRELPKAAMFQLAEEGYRSVFELLVGCIISIRTRDEVTLPVARQLLARARTPEQMRQLRVREIDALIGECTYHRPKSKQIAVIAREAIKNYGGELPCEPKVLLSLSGVGPKCTNLVLGIACGLTAISVDIHVHRITNRWGIVAEKTPEKTMRALQRILPKRYWVEINSLLVPFGKHICTVSPHCSTCPLLEMCQQIGVTKHK